MNNVLISEKREAVKIQVERQAFFLLVMQIDARYLSLHTKLHPFIMVISEDP